MWERNTWQKRKPNETMSYVMSLVGYKKKMFIGSVILAICNAILVIVRLEALMLK